MEVILLDKIRNLGQLGDKVNVKAGFGRNFLIPKGKAVPATALNLKKFEAKRAELEKAAKEAFDIATKEAEILSQLAITIGARAGEEGKLFGSIGTHDLEAAIIKAGHKVKRSEIKLPTGPLRYVGEYAIDIHLHGDVVAAVKVTVVAE